MVAARACPAFSNHSHVTELACHPQHSMPGPAIDHKTAANAGAQRDHAEVFNMLPRAQPFFTYRGAVSVIFQDHRSTQPHFQIVAHRISAPVREV